MRTLFANTREVVLACVKPAHINGYDPKEPTLDVEHVRDGYLRAYFFCPALSDLSGMGSLVWNAAKQVVPGSDIPSKELLSTAFKGDKPVSLEGLMRIHIALRAIVSSPRHPDVAATIQRILPGGSIPKKSIVQSMHYIRPKKLAETRRELGFEDRIAFSTKLFDQGPLSKGSYTRFLIAYLEDGYAAKHDAERGDYKVTAEFAHELYQRLSLMSEQKGKKAQSFSEYFAYGASWGRRNGHSVMALPRSLGNLVAV